jgi:hypothetical protein
LVLDSKRQLRPTSDLPLRTDQAPQKIYIATASGTLASKFATPAECFGSKLQSQHV